VKEYALNDQYVRFLTNRLVPWVDAHYTTCPEPSARAIIGASFGAFSAAYAALHRPDIFGLVGGQSGPYSYLEDTLLRDFTGTEQQGIRFHLTVGEFETDLSGKARPEDNYLAAQRRFVDSLRTKGFAVESAEYPEGHQWGLWRAHIGDMLKYFWKC
jgi:enterochelin esterase-like enzyme